MSFEFLAATFGSPKSSGWATIPFVVLRNFQIAVLSNTFERTFSQTIPADILSVLDPAGQGLVNTVDGTANFTALSQLTMPFTDINGTIFNVVLSFTNPDQLVIKVRASASNAASVNVTFDAIIFPNKGVTRLIH